MKTTRIAAGAVIAATGATAIAAVAAVPAQAAAKAKTVTGPSVSTPFGPVQVKATVKGTKVTKVTAIDYPSGGESTRINARAIPALQQQAMAKQSAYIDGVTGASWSSYAFAKSLQAALLQAGIK